MALTVGSQLGSHEITALLGKGGMGEVYRARDLKLKREVAIKILPEEFARDSDRLLRFQREAELLASLNHQNIAAIYDIGEDGSSRFIVLELVEGETLAELLERGPIPLDDALRIATSICEALEAAHEKGIVHRDLKPANVKVTPDGRVKVLDFGLAKTQNASSGNSSLSHSPTLMSMAATNAGVILGTAAYMSPEQARGAVVDKRSDIWAFGIVFYEMLTGKSPFTAPTLSDTLALVLTKDPDLTAVPERVRPLLRRCLERDVRRRLRDIGDAAILLEATPATSVTAPAAPRHSKRLSFVLGSIGLISTIAAAVFAFRHLNERDEIPRLVQFQIPVQGVLRPTSLGVSPDGRYVSFQVQDSSNGAITRIHALDSLETRTLLDVPRSRLAWSPNSKSAFFFSDRKLKRIDVGGGPIETVMELEASLGPGTPLTQPRGDKWLYRLRTGETLEIPPNGGAPVRLLPPITGLLDLHFLPDNRRFLFSAGDASVPGTTMGIFAGSIEKVESLGSQWKTARPFATTDAPLFATVASADNRQTYVLFMRDGAVVAQGLDKDKLQASGPPVTIAMDLSDFAASRDVLAYSAGRNAGAISQLQWFDRRGSRLTTLGEPGAPGDTYLSKDGKTVMIDRVDSRANHVWLGDTTRGVFTRLTSSSTNETAGALTPDGGAVLTMSGAGTLGDLFIVRPNSGTPELLTTSPLMKHPNDVSPDGKYLIYDEHGRQAQDLMILPLNAGANAKPVPFLATAADETFGQFSPDGKWIAYMSSESGRPEVYVRAFLPDQNPAAGGRKWIVSTAGGNKPRWSHDGKELFYLAPDGKLMATPVQIGQTFDLKIPVALFDAQFTGYFPYDVSPDGRFLINTPVTTELAATSSINVIVNWSSILRKRD